jgi:hypothetical protein
MIKGKAKRPTAQWDITANRFVGFIDIMGFKDLVARNSHDSIYKMMLKTTDAVRANQSVFGVDYESDNYDMNIIMMTYSDSIMIYSKDDSSSSLENFIGAISSLAEDLFIEEIPHKGAVAHGTMTLDFGKSIFFGQPLIDAYLLQEELSFYGIVIHATAEYKGGLKNDESVYEYLCPFKSGIGKHLTILPSTFVNDPYDVKEFKKLMKSVSRLGRKTSGSLRKYIDNTEKYLDSANTELVKK